MSLHLGNDPVDRCQLPPGFRYSGLQDEPGTGSPACRVFTSI